MGLGKKIQPAKAAWLWCDSVDIANITDDNIKTAYRLDMQKCKPSACRRNCRTNPFCIANLGETKWLSQSMDVSDDEDVSLEVRKPNTFVGLKNLGATCYVNSLLQLWFHNTEFREAMFLWNPAEDPDENERLLSGESNGVDFNQSRSPVGHLQLLFVLMHFGKQKTLDPKDFIQALDLDSTLQQDAQEFSKLFISLLEDTLKHQSNPKVKNFITNNFLGEYSYITRCSKCQKESVSPSTFYELQLNVKGNKSLHESLREFLKEEKMEGANAYSCSECAEKQEATRFIRLEKLPPVLNLQLMRFIYDRFFKDLKGVENVYTQHQPLMKEVIEDLIRGRLKDAVYPFLGNAPSGRRVQDIVVFMIGGVTYEESLCVHLLNKSSLHGGARIVVGGTTVHNSESFIDEVAKAMSRGISRPYK